MQLKENPATRLAWKLGIIYRKHMQNIAGVSENYGLRSGQSRILNTIEEMNGSAQKEIADKLNISPASMAVSVRRMQKAGLVEKMTDETDLRHNKIYATQAGRDIMSNCRQELIRYDNNLVRGFSPEEIAQFDAYLTRLLENLKKGEQSE